MSSSSFLVASLGFPMYSIMSPGDSLGFPMSSIMSPGDSDSLASSFLIWIPFVSFSCLIALARTSSIMLNLSDKSRHPCVIPDLRRKTSSLSSLAEYDVSCWFFVYDLSYVKEVLFYPWFIVFIMKGCWILSDAFFVSIEMIMWSFFLHSTAVIY